VAGSEGYNSACLAPIGVQSMWKTTREVAAGQGIVFPIAANPNTGEPAVAVTTPPDHLQLVQSIHAIDHALSELKRHLIEKAKLTVDGQSGVS
jgi:hypothetical protein